MSKLRFRTFGQSFGSFGLRFGWWGPFGFAGVGARPYRRRTYLCWLRRYKEELEEELHDVEDELRDLEGEEGKGKGQTQ